MCTLRLYTVCLDNSGALSFFFGSLAPPAPLGSLAPSAPMRISASRSKLGEGVLDDDLLESHHSHAPRDPGRLAHVMLEDPLGPRRAEASHCTQELAVPIRRALVRELPLPDQIK